VSFGGLGFSGKPAVDDGSTELDQSADPYQAGNLASPNHPVNVPLGHVQQVRDLAARIHGRTDLAIRFSQE
jgi:hypothetical protein